MYSPHHRHHGRCCSLALENRRSNPPGRRRLRVYGRSVPLCRIPNRTCTRYGLLHHTVILVADSCRLPQSIGNAYHVALSVIGIANKLLGTSVRHPQVEALNESRIRMSDCDPATAGIGECRKYAILIGKADAPAIQVGNRSQQIGVGSMIEIFKIIEISLL